MMFKKTTIWLPFLLSFFGLACLAQETSYGLKIEQIISSENQMPLLRVRFFMVKVHEDGHFSSKWPSVKDRKGFYQKINGKGHGVITWMFKYHQSYGVLTYRVLSKKEKKDLKLRSGIYLNAEEVTKNIFLDESYKQNIKSSQETSSLEGLLSLDVSEIDAALEEKGGIDSLIEEMIMEENAKLVKHKEAGYFLLVQKKHG